MVQDTGVFGIYYVETPIVISLCCSLNAICIRKEGLGHVTTALEFARAVPVLTREVH